MLAELNCIAGNGERAHELVARARRILPRRRVSRHDALERLEAIQRRLEGGVDTDRAADQSSGQHALPFADPHPADPSQANPKTQISTVTDSARGAPPAPVGRARAGVPEAGPAHVPCPATLEIPVAATSGILGLDILQQPPAAGPEEVTLALMATALHDAESFDRLLALEHTQGLLRLSHQEETARRVLAVFLGRALLADEVGLGKTIEAGLVLSEYLLRGRVQRALILAPPSLVGQWREELAGKFGIATRTTGDERRQDLADWWDGPGVIVASLATARSERHRETVATRPWDLVIVDEAHTLKNHRTESYALVERLQGPLPPATHRHANREPRRGAL
ncbi:MAG: DEAD/DEAH box helicase family protein [Deltaproteobacteria bacterium]|nr:DEAD/DEAH box helicase family protein [Deltaproteobacteria bacterium]